MRGYPVRCGLSTSLRAKRSNPLSPRARKDGLLRFARNDGWMATEHEIVIPREGGVSSTLRLFGSIINVSGILDHPPSRVMTAEYDVAFSRRIAPEVCMNLSLPENGGSRECRVLAAPAVSC